MTWDYFSELPSWAAPVTPVEPESCYGGHWSCLPALNENTDPTRLHGMEITLVADGYASLKTNKDVYRRILTVRLAGLWLF